MKPLIVLLAVFGIAWLVLVITGHADLRLAGVIAMSAMLAFTAIGHFAFPKGMAEMLPPSVPLRTQLVFFTGAIEVAAAIGLLVPGLQHLTAMLLIVFFVLVLPANIYAAWKKVDYQKGTHDGPGLRYLWFRVPLQLFFVAWVWYFCLRG